MTIREALINELDELLPLAEPTLDQNAMATLLNGNGHAWVCEIQQQLTGFAVADLDAHHIVQVFVKEEYRQKEIGTHLLAVMLDWLFTHDLPKVWLSTATNTDAAGFFTHLGWEHNGFNSKGELIFQLTKASWQEKKNLPGNSSQE